MKAIEDRAVQQTVAAAETAVIAAPGRQVRRGWVGDAVFSGLATVSGIFVLLLLGGTIVELFLGGLRAFETFGIGFLRSDIWDPVSDEYDALVSIFGTLITSVIAPIFAVPLGFGIAFYLTELAPEWFRRPVGIAIELLAAVPSIIYGMWGFLALVPILGQDIQPFLQDNTAGWPIFDTPFSGPTFGIGVLTAAIVLAIMVLPFIAATMRDVFMQVPAMYKESAYGLGATTWEVVRHVVIPYTRTSVVGGIMLGLCRLNKPMASLPITIYPYAGSAFEEWIQLAWVGALLITIGVLALNIVARTFLHGVRV